MKMCVIYSKSQPGKLGNAGNRVSSICTAGGRLPVARPTCITLLIGSRTWKCQGVVPGADTDGCLAATHPLMPHTFSILYGSCRTCPAGVIKAMNATPAPIFISTSMPLDRLALGYSSPQAGDVLRTGKALFDFMLILANLLTYNYSNLHFTMIWSIGKSILLFCFPLGSNDQLCYFLEQRSFLTMSDYQWNIFCFCLMKPR